MGSRHALSPARIHPSSFSNTGFTLFCFCACFSYGWHYSLAASAVFHIRRLPDKLFKIRKEKKMAKKGEVYKCDVCGNVVSVVTEGTPLFFSFIGISR
jgi:desulfoferrodoxin-like iron-binding protein